MPDADRINRTLLDAMPYRAPDGAACWTGAAACGAIVSLGLGYMRVLPEDPSGAVVFASGALHLVADLRLDNRDELLTQLSLGTDTPDAGILLAAYAAWAEHCVYHLLGDFAFILYDEASDRLFAARDHMGVKPLFYRQEAEGLLLASEARVLRQPGPPFNDLGRYTASDRDLARFMGGYVLPQNDDEVVRRLLGGHVLICEGGGPAIVRAYWEPRPAADGSRNDPAAFRALFEDAVFRRMRGTGSVAAMMSGGLDSTSIACTAALQKPPLDSFSMVFDRTPVVNEREYIEAAIARGGFRPHFLHLDDYDPVTGLDKLLALHSRPFIAPGLVMTQALLDAVKGEGFRVVLDGHGGDEVVSQGVTRLHELAASGEWGKLWRECRGSAAIYGHNRTELFVLYVIRHGRFKGAHHLRKLAAWWERRKSNDLDVPDLLGARLTGYESEHQMPPRPLTESEAHLANLKDATQIDALEILELTAAGSGIEMRFPFMDKRLIEFCLALPAEAKLDQGFGRMILRRAMDGILPPAVQWRRSKINFTPLLAGGAVKYSCEAIEDLICEATPGLSGCVNLATVQTMWSRMKKAGAQAKGQDVQAVLRTVLLALWLRFAHGETSGMSTPAPKKDHDD